MAPKSLLRELFSLYLHFVVDYVTRVTYDSGTIQNCAWTVTAQRRFEPLTNARGYHRVLRVAHTLSDLDGADKASRVHLAEALSYRALADEVRRAA
jgi:Magnesium chelatase, subunit ChlI C-terminal